VDESKVKTGGKNLKFIVMAVECALSLERELGGNLFSDVHDVIDLAMLINLIGIRNPKICLRLHNCPFE